MYTYEQVEKESLKYFSGDRLAMDTWIGKYCLKDQLGNYYELTPDDMFERLATEFSRVENGYSNPLPRDKILNYFKNWQIVPQGSVLYGAGNPYSVVSLSNCVTTSFLKDSIGGIFYADQQLAQFHKRRCGVGLDITPLRPKDAKTNNAAHTSTGAVSFMEKFSETTRTIGQSGRRGASLQAIHIAHPDSLEFIKIKQDLTKVTGSNVSVIIDNMFMFAVQNDEMYNLHWPVHSLKPEIVIPIKARDLWNELIKCAHATSEPGILFEDAHNNYSTSHCYPAFKNHVTNACGEQMLGGPNVDNESGGSDACRLMVVNLYTFVDNPFTSTAIFNFDRFYETVYDGMRLIDDLVDLEIESIDKILQKIEIDVEPEYVKDVERRSWLDLRYAAQQGRRVGYGFTALADMLAALNLKYSSIEAIEFVEKVMHCKCEAEFESSIDLAMERGAFANYDADVESHSTFIKFFKLQCPDLHAKMLVHGRRNIQISTVAPSGSVSILTQTTSGLEPVYQLEYTRRKKTNSSTGNADFVDDKGDRWEEFKVYHPKFKIWEQLNKSKKVDDSPYFCQTAHEINWENRVKMQAVIQRYTTNSLSTTLNVPEDITCEEISKIYLESWKQGCKGATIYREGSRSGVLVSNATHAKQNGKPVKRPQILPCDLHTFNLLENGELEQWLAFVGLHEGKPFEIFIGKRDWMLAPVNYDKLTIEKDKTEEGNKYYLVSYLNDGMFIFGNLAQCFNSEFWNYAKLVSGLLRHNMPIEYIVHTIESMKFENTSLHSWQNGVVRVLKSYIAEGTLAKNSCESCLAPGTMIYQNGCATCVQCGYSKCS